MLVDSALVTSQAHPFSKHVQGIPERAPFRTMLRMIYLVTVGQYGITFGLAWIEDSLRFRVGLHFLVIGFEIRLIKGALLEASNWKST